MPLSTVSRGLAELEDQLNLRLLERSTRNLRLTDVGSEVQHCSAKVAALVNIRLNAVPEVLERARIQPDLGRVCYFHDALSFEVFIALPVSWTL
jgi:DNA-binding transcriptional LysR family regulator